jgi:hypothetical protein
MRIWGFPTLGNSLGIGNEAQLWSINKPEDIRSTHFMIEKGEQDQ